MTHKQKKKLIQQIERSQKSAPIMVSPKVTINKKKVPVVVSMKQNSCAPCANHF
jgi:hypothetical protein